MCLWPSGPKGLTDELALSQREGRDEAEAVLGVVSRRVLHRFDDLGLGLDLVDLEGTCLVPCQALTYSHKFVVADPFEGGFGRAR